jgi:hypothetical protein
MHASSSIKEECDRFLLLDHQEHEDIVRSLQDGADPYSTPFLKQVIRLKPLLRHLDYDD